MSQGQGVHNHAGFAQVGYPGYGVNQFYPQQQLQQQQQQQMMLDQQMRGYGPRHC